MAPLAGPPGQTPATDPVRRIPTVSLQLWTPSRGKERGGKKLPLVYLPVSLVSSWRDTDRNLARQKIHAND